MLPRGLIDRLQRVKRWVRGRRAAVALIFALSTPLLLATTGLAVDVGYWQQQQTSLQSAADSAVLAAANAGITYSTVTTSSAASPFALAAANASTNYQYNFAATGSATVTVTPNSSTPTQWAATVIAPRKVFFSGVRGLGVSGMGIGTQTANAVAGFISTTPNTCLLVSGQVTANSSGAQIIGSGCSLYSGSTGGCPFSANGGVIKASNVYTATGVTEGTNCATNSGSYVGTTAGYTGTTPAVTGVTATAKPADLVSIPSVTNGTTQISTASAGLTDPSTVAANNMCNGDSSTNKPTNVMNTGLYIALVAGCYYSDTSNISPSLGLFAGTSNITIPPLLATSGITEINGGITSTGSGVANIFFGGTEDYVNGGINVQFTSSSGKLTTPTSTTGTYAFNGGFQMNNTNAGNAVTLGPGTYYFNNNGGVALTLGSSIAFSIAANSTAYVNGQVYASNNVASASFGIGTYVFNGAVTIPGGNVSFAGGTYYFENGLSITNNSSIYFGPGIYYILGGTLNLGPAANITSNGATFVFENNASYYLHTNSNEVITMTAPTTNCIAPSAFTSADTSGEGICNVLFYQLANDTATDKILADSPITLTGIISQAGSALDLSGGNSTIQAATGGILEIQAASLSNPNTTKLTLSSSSSGGASGGTPIAMLVQ
jgi:Flp pilus assembly protein TadG